MRRCANQKLEASEAELARVYARVEAGVDPSRRKALADAQEAWKGYRDKQAAFAASIVQDGTLYYVVQAMELTRLNRERIGRLETEASHLEGADPPVRAEETVPGDP